MHLAYLDFQQLRIKHIAFKSKVRAVLYGGAYDKEMFSTCNPVTVWFEEIGNAKYGNEPELFHLKRMHVHFCDVAHQLVTRYHQDLIDQAYAGLDELNELSDSFLKLLDSFQKRFSDAV